MGARGLAIRDDLDAAALRRFAQGETDRCAALRALAIAQALEGAIPGSSPGRAEAARFVGRERQSLRDAVLRYNAEGLAGLRDRPRLGRREKLDVVQREALRTWVLRGPDPEADGMSSYRLLDIAAHIQERWAVLYTLSALSRLLRRMGLSWQKARPAHPKGSVEARELYKKPHRRVGGHRRRSPRQDDPALVRG
jgi:transposase